MSVQSCLWRFIEYETWTYQSVGLRKAGVYPSYIIQSFRCSGAAKKPIPAIYRTPPKIKLHSQIHGTEKTCSFQTYYTLLYDEREKEENQENGRECKAYCFCLGGDRSPKCSWEKEGSCFSKTSSWQGVHVQCCPVILLTELFSLWVLTCHQSQHPPAWLSVLFLQPINHRV